MVVLASDFDKSKYLRAEDLKAEKKFRIKEVTVEGMADKEQKLTVWFTNDKRGLVLNKTNNRTLRGEFGDDVSDWKDKIIVVFPTMVDFRGKWSRGCVFVSHRRSKQAKLQRQCRRSPSKAATVRWQRQRRRHKSSTSLGKRNRPRSRASPRILMMRSTSDSEVNQSGLEGVHLPARIFTECCDVEQQKAHSTTA